MLQDYRKRIGFTQEKLAEYANIDIRTVQRIEKGIVIPTLDTFAKIIIALNMTDKEIAKEVKKSIKIMQNKKED